MIPSWYLLGSRMAAIASLQNLAWRTLCSSHLLQKSPCQLRFLLQILSLMKQDPVRINKWCNEILWDIYNHLYYSFSFFFVYFFQSVTPLTSTYLSSLVSIVWFTILLDFVYGNTDHLLFQAHRPTPSSTGESQSLLASLPYAADIQSRSNLLGDWVQAETEASMKYEMLPLRTSSNLIVHLWKT